LGLSSDSNNTGLSNFNIGGGFGWVDFLGTGSEKAVGARMRKLEQRLLHASEHDRINSNKVVTIGACALDDPRTLVALRQIFQSYTTTTSSGDRTKDSDPSIPQAPPLAFVLFGSFTNQPAMSVSAASTHSSTTSSIPDSIAYKEAFDALALLLSDFPNLLRHSTFVFVPGDADPWPSAFSAGGAVPLPRQGIPEVFTSRVRRAFANANANADVRANQSGPDETRKHGEAVWSSNPCRVSLFGPSCEMLLFRDDIAGRMRRHHIPLKAREEDGASAGDNADVSASEAQVEGTAAAAADADAMEMDQSDQDQVADATSSKAKTTAPQWLTKTLLDQSHLSPFPLDIRPQHWSYAPSALSLYPLPNVLVLCDTEVEPFVLGYQSCIVINAGRVVEATDAAAGVTAKNARCTWCEYDVGTRRGVVRSL